MGDATQRTRPGHQCQPKIPSPGHGPGVEVLPTGSLSIDECISVFQLARAVHATDRMEPPAKRQRVDFDFTNGSKPSHNTKHAIEAVEMADDGGFGEEFDEDYDADEDLQTERAQLDYKLKSTFEAIFEKYGKDFDGIGDEIDLNTGRILVNNGHLVQMQDEGDAGSGRSCLDDSSNFSQDEEMEEESDGNLNEDDDEDSNGEDDYLSEGDMIEDDLILRGFSQASRFIHQQPQGTPISGYIEYSEENRRASASRPRPTSNVTPSQSEILSQFGPQLGPEIAQYVKQSGAFDDTSVETAWRAPPMPASRPKTNLKPRPAMRKPEIERSPSPKYSVWATNGGKEKATRIRTNFTEKEDTVMLDFVAQVRQKGLDFWAHQTWRILEAKVRSP